MLPASAVLLVAAVAMLASLTVRSVHLPVYPFVPPPIVAIPEQTAAPFVIRRLAQGQLIGPESIAVRRDGVLYAGTADGHIVSVTRDRDGSDKVRIVATVGGRPLGLHFSPKDDRILYVAEAVKGLMAVNVATGEFEILTSQSDDARAISYANDLDVSKDGTSIYLSDSTIVRPILESDNTWSTMKAAKLDILAAQRSGRLLEYDVEKRTTISLLEGLAFANGVALSENEDFVLVCESTKYRVTRLWLDGRTPQVETFIGGLPGYPDGVTRAVDGGFWVSIVSPRNALLDLLHPWPWVKWLGMQLPWALQPEPAMYGMVLHYDSSGRLTHSLHDADGTHVAGITSVTESDDRSKLYIGGLARDHIAVHDLQQAAR